MSMHITDFTIKQFQLTITKDPHPNLQKLTQGNAVLYMRLQINRQPRASLKISYEKTKNL